MPHTAPEAATTLLRGTLHIYLAFDWGDEIRLDEVGRLVPASAQALPRRRRTPLSFSYRPAPLHLPLAPTYLDLPVLGPTTATVGVTLFDFAAVSIAFRVPLAGTPDHLKQLAGALANPTMFLDKARELLRPLYQQLLPAIHDPQWQDDLSEEYFVFQFGPEARTQATDAAWLAGLVHLESDGLSAEETDEALRYRLSYGPEDLFVPDWTAAVLIDRDCDDTLQAIEFANLQLLEFRHIDNRLDDSLAAASRLMQSTTRRVWMFWRIHAHPMRVLGELKVEANGLFERTGNVLKLVGDPYLARAYRMVTARFHTETWIENIQRKLDVAEGIYQVVSDQANHFRSQFLEFVVVLLIVFEIVLAFWH